MRSRRLAGQQALAAELAALGQRAEADIGSLEAVRLAEVRYLSAVATQRLRLERDVPGTCAFLSGPMQCSRKGTGARDVPCAAPLERPSRASSAPRIVWWDSILKSSSSRASPIVCPLLRPFSRGGAERAKRQLPA